jgi:hypothetical protein
MHEYKLLVLPKNLEWWPPNSGMLQHVSRWIFLNIFGILLPPPLGKFLYLKIYSVRSYERSGKDQKSIWHHLVTFKVKAAKKSNFIVIFTLNYFDRVIIYLPVWSMYTKEFWPVSLLITVMTPQWKESAQRERNIISEAGPHHLTFKTKLTVQSVSQPNQRSRLQIQKVTVDFFRSVSHLQTVGGTKTSGQ